MTSWIYTPEKLINDPQPEIDPQEKNRKINKRPGRLLGRLEYLKSNDVFIDHYLRDSARLLSEDSWGIGSLVVAQQAISARPRQRRHRGHKKK